MVPSLQRRTKGIPASCGCGTCTAWLCTPSLCIASKFEVWIGIRVQLLQGPSVGWQLPQVHNMSFFWTPSETFVREVPRNDFFVHRVKWRPQGPSLVVAMKDRFCTMRVDS
mmetsp:Transcript_31848/g.82491  ORF Transcript_31848/g.82491 Transcript_31848/m.82491 type:complete len:111 (+) Transcript_31848:1091-1423(+)